MVQFQVSAPGKVILFGEHAVVYGKTAVAASLNLRTTLKFVELPKSHLEDIIKIEFPSVKLSLTLPLCTVLDFFFSNNFNCSLIENSDQLHNYVKDFVDLIENVIDNDNDDSIMQQKLSLRAFFYLLVYIAYKEQIDIKNTSFHVHLSTELMINAGLGSSASFAVCLAACFLYWSLLQKGIAHDTFNDYELDKISNYALNCEQVMHESPSGIDNSVCTYGSIIKFRETLINTLPPIPNLKILLVNSNVIRNTKDQVMRLAREKDLHPPMILPILDSIDILSNDAWKTLTEISSQAHESTDSSMEQDWYKKLSTLINMNQGFLNVLDMSHPKLDMICAMAEMESYAGKLTGAGGGGYAYILLPPNTEDESIKLFSQKLEENNFHVTNTSLGGNGVKIEH